mgnify:FL=1
MKYGLQLYSVRDAAEKDYEMTLREVAAMGYEYVEPAGFFGHSAEQVKEWLDKYGLTVSGTHSGFGDLENDFAGTVKYHKTIGNKRYIVPGVDTSNKEALDHAVELFNKYQPMLAAEGIELGYHNHHREFILNGNAIYPNLYFKEKTNIKFEIDTFWAFVAHRDPVTVLEEFKDRLIGCIHLKDGNRYPTVAGKALGEGSAPVRDVMAKAKDLGLLMVVESEGLNPTGLEEVKRCADFLKKETV